MVNVDLTQSRQKTRIFRKETGEEGGAKSLVLFGPAAVFNLLSGTSEFLRKKPNRWLAGITEKFDAFHGVIL